MLNIKLNQIRLLKFETTGRFSGFRLEDFLEIRLYESKLYELELYESILYEMLLSRKKHDYRLNSKV